ncbi:MAG: TIR domain-containing protein [Pseudomonadota bacterium]
MVKDKVKNVFISHHHKDDAHVDKLTKLLHSKDYHIRNSSIRAKPTNQKRLDKGLVKDATIKRLLRMKISWAGSVIVLVGKETHKRPWVDWEITQAHKQGKTIVGVYEYGLKEKVELPKSLEKYQTAQVGWDSQKIIDAIEGRSVFEYPGGSPYTRKDAGHYKC